MEYINKTNSSNLAKAHLLLDGFLSRCSQGVKWPNDLYAALSSDVDPNVPNAENTYILLRRLILKENNGRCCYCMRSIGECDTTLEHVIPNKTRNQSDYDGYKGYFSSSDWKIMVFAEKFLKSPKWPFCSYPHTIAYENLIPSCNGKFAKISNGQHAPDDRTSKSCNNFRGNSFVVPFVFNKTMVSEFEYTERGYVVWPVDANITGNARKQLLKHHKDTIDNLGLNCDELVAIRRIWCFLAKNGLKHDQKLDKDRAMIFLTTDGSLLPQTKEMLNNFWEDDRYWNLLEDYQYFNDVKKFK